jgi:hypothetical protein
MGMRAFERSPRFERATGLIDEGAYAIRIIDLSGDQDSEVVRQADQSAVEHPVRSAGEGNPIADDIGTVRVDRSDMGGVDLCATTPIDQLEPI